MTHSVTFGTHAVAALIEKQPRSIIRLLIQQDKRDKSISTLIARAKEHRLPVEYVDKAILERLADGGNHQGILVERVKTTLYQESDLPALIDAAGIAPLFLILDGIQDPHNLGACLRSADAFGVHAVIIPKDKSVGVTPTVSKVASGALESVPIVQVTNLARAINTLKEAGIWIYGAAGEGTSSLFDARLNGPIAIALGAEGTGLRRLTRELCDGLISIPMQGVVSSLNVSVATGIFLFEVAKQRQVK